MTEIYHDGWRLWDWDPATGRSIWTCQQDGQTIFRVDYPIDGVVRANAEMRAETAGQRHGEWEKIASMPLNLFHSSGYAEASQQGDRKWMKRFLNDPDNRAWRTKDSKV